jgi:hypothetical protein
MGKFYMAAEAEKDGKFAAFVITATRDDNLVHVLAGYSGLISVCLCKTKHEAECVAGSWNEYYREAGMHMYC